MKLLLLAGMAFLGLAASGPAARAVPSDFTYTGSLVTFTVPTTDTYQILAFGAQGGNNTALGGTGGGLGADIGGNFNLVAGEVLQIAVGGAGMPGGGFCRPAAAVAEASWSALVTHRWSSPVVVAEAATSLA